MADNSFPFKILEVPRHVPLHNEGRRLISTMDKCGVFLCTGGKLTVSIEKGMFDIQSGDMFIYIPSMLLHVEYTSPDASGLMVEADTDYALLSSNRVLSIENLLFMREHPYLSLPAEQTDLLKRLVAEVSHRMKAEASQNLNPTCRQLEAEVVKSMGQMLFYEVLNIYFRNCPTVPVSQTKPDMVLQNFMIALFQNFRKEREVTFYANLQHITPRYFSNIIKEKSGIKPSNWIVQMVITEAKQLLEASNLSIKEISVQLNFPCQTFFGKYFKHYVGVSPKEYRKRFFHTEEAD